MSKDYNQKSFEDPGIICAELRQSKFNLTESLIHIELFSKQIKKYNLMKLSDPIWAQGAANETTYVPLEFGEMEVLDNDALSYPGLHKRTTIIGGLPIETRNLIFSHQLSTIKLPKLKRAEFSMHHQCKSIKKTPPWATPAIIKMTTVETVIE